MAIIVKTEPNEYQKAVQNARKAVEAARESFKSDVANAEKTRDAAIDAAWTALRVYLKSIGIESPYSYGPEAHTISVDLLIQDLEVQVYEALLNFLWSLHFLVFQTPRRRPPLNNLE